MIILYCFILTLIVILLASIFPIGQFLFAKRKLSISYIFSKELVEYEYNTNYNKLLSRKDNTIESFSDKRNKEYEHELP